RLVRSEAERADDSPAIVVLSRLSLRNAYRLCRTAGMCKLVLASREPAGDLKPSQRARWGWLRASLASTVEDARTQASRDVQSVHSLKLPKGQRSARIGLLTIARLLVDAEPFRLRWALQHWPYPIAKLIRSLIPTGADRDTPLIQSE